MCVARSITGYNGSFCPPNLLTENVVIPPPAQKTFDAEGEILETCFEEIPPDSERGR
jgi:hypothetical protein